MQEFVYCDRLVGFYAASQHQHWNAFDVLELTSERGPIGFGESMVEDHEVDRTGPQNRLCLRGIVSSDEAKAMSVQQEEQRLESVAIVVNAKNGVHGNRDEAHLTV